MPTTEDLYVQALRGSMNERLRKAAEQIIIEETAKAAAEIERRLRGSVGAMVTEILNRSTFERFGSDLRITIQIENAPKT